MAIETIMLESFEGYNSIPTDCIGEEGKWAYQSNTATSSVTVKTGQRAMALMENGYAGLNLPKEYRKVIIGFAILFESLPNTADHGNFLYLYDKDSNSTGVIQLSLALNTSGNMELWRGDVGTGTKLDTGTAVITANSWYYMEISVFVDDAAGAYELKIDGSADFSGTSVDTQVHATNNAIEQIRFRMGDATPDSSDDFVIDNIYIRGDETTNTAGGFFGPIEIARLNPNANGFHRDWTPSAGTDDFAVVDETYFSTSDYISNSVDGERLTMGFEDLGVPDTIIAVQLVNISKIETGGGRNHIPLCRSNGTTYTGPSRRVTEYGPSLEIYETDPDTATTWTQGGLNAAEFGVETD